MYFKKFYLSINFHKSCSITAVNQSLFGKKNLPLLEQIIAILFSNSSNVVWIINFTYYLNAFIQHRPPFCNPCQQQLLFAISLSRAAFLNLFALEEPMNKN